MSTRSIDLSTLPLAYPPALEWIKANGLDPKAVVRKQAVYVDEHALTLERFVLTASGAKQLGPDYVPLIQKVTVPLISAPENHGL